MRWFIATTATVLIGTVLTLGCKQAVEGVIRHNPTFTALEATLVRGELQKALLTAADLPGSGWEEADPAEDDGKIGPPSTRLQQPSRGANQPSTSSSSITWSSFTARRAKPKRRWAT